MASTKSWKIVENAVYGRHLIAIREIPAGEVIIDELPLVSGPVVTEQNSDTKVCLVCYKTLPPEYHKCSSCGVNLCSEFCSRELLHSQNECRIFKHLGLFPGSSPGPGFSTKTLYNFVLSVRCLRLKLTNPVAWEKVLQLQSKTEELEEVGAFKEIEGLFCRLKWEHFEGGSESLLPSEEIVPLLKHSLGAMRTNGFSSHNHEGLYFLSSLMTHSCIMNTDRQILLDQMGRMVTRAARTISPGEVITTSYLIVLQGTFERWRQTTRNWFFTCTCPRCLDGGEFQTDLSTISCPSCDLMELRPKITTEDCSLVWECGSESCRVKIKFPLDSDSSSSEQELKLKSYVLEALSEGEKERPKDLSDFEGLEQWLSKGGRRLHRNHSEFMQIKSYLCEFYGRNKENGITDLEDEELAKKLSHCQEVLGVWGRLFGPLGIYLQRGAILFETWITLREMRRRKDHILSENFLQVDTSDERINEIKSSSMKMLQFGKDLKNYSEMLNFMLEN